MSAPAVTICIEFEAAPRVMADCLNSDEMDHMNLWLDRHPELAELVARAIELAETRRAA